MSWIKTVSPQQATGELADIYRKIAGTRNDVASVHQIQSLNPKAMLAHLELYKSVVFRRGSLDRIARERIAVVVSATNRCPYCIGHHAEALRKLGDDQAIVSALAEGQLPASLSEADKTLLDWAHRMTATPSDASEAEIHSLRSHGFDDEAILAATMTCAYFNFVNRIVLLLGVHIEDNFEHTCEDEQVG